MTLDLALATLRARRTAFAGAFLALVLGSALITTMALTLAATLGEPHPGPPRYAAADTVVVPSGPDNLALPPPAALPPGTAAAVGRAGRTGRTIVDRTFAVGLPGGAADTVGHGWSSAALTPYRLTAGHPPEASGQIVVTAAGPARLGARVRLLTPLGAGTYTVVGVTDRMWFENAVFFTDAAAARLSPPVNALAVTADPGTVRAALGGRTALVLHGAGTALAAPAPSGLYGAQSMAGTTTAIAVAVAVFIVIATFAFLVEQRTRELALLRLVGATPRQVRRLVRAEAAVLGACAACCGLVLGCVGTGPLRDWMVAHGVAPYWFRIGLDPVALVVAFLLGVGAAFAGAATAAWRASRNRPVDALREAPAATRAMSPLRWLLGGVSLAGALAAGLGIAAASPASSADPGAYFEVPVLLTAGLALLAPVLLRPAARLATRPLARLGAPALLVRQNTLNARRRAAATLTPVAVAVGLVAGMLCMEATAGAATAEQAHETLHADWVVTPAAGTVLDAAAVTTLRSSAGVAVTAESDGVVFLGTADGTFLDSLDLAALPARALGSVVTPRVVAGSLRDLPADYVVVDQDTAADDGLAVGRTLTVWQSGGGRARATVTAIVADAPDGADGYLSARIAGTVAPDLAWLRLRAGTPTGPLAAAMRADGARAEPLAAYLAGLQAADRVRNRVADIVILGLAVLYALFAIANTLVMATSGRRGELAALGLAGASRAQVLRVVTGEAALAVALGTLPAVPVVVVVVVLQRLALRQLVTRLSTSVPWSTLGATIGLCAVVAVAAAAAAAWRVTSHPALDAVAGE